ncbi:FecR domain-containing protein [Magnetospira sp. QH-2]|uniref:FecR family protein n=1 Tax=Magnetospira sp. (strain QH-2) TaxID=1288970 RepID=UPI0003E81BBC|nr:FecR domain-containing protein [Magnetospira sp. QH-2]CCQ75353.1 exported protein of unknown function [Magnetospira sp. QH-2]
MSEMAPASRKRLPLILIALLVLVMAQLQGDHTRAMGVDRTAIGLVEEATDAWIVVPGGQKKPLTPDMPLYLSDRIQTGSKGRVALRFTDDTFFSLGSKADILVDEFIYEPGMKGSRFSVRIAQGAFRFLSGQIAHLDAENFKVSTPVATIGIRGTHGLAVVEKDSTGCIVLLRDPRPGKEKTAMTVQSGGQMVVIDRHGWGSEVKGMGMAPTKPHAWSPERVAEMRKLAGD